MLTPEEKKELRQHASEVLARLEQEGADAQDTTSWIQPTADDNRDRSALCRSFDYTGFCRVPAFCDLAECTAMKEQMAALVEQQGNPDGWEAFGTNDAANTARGDSFLASADRVHFFAEPSALTEEGRLLPEYESDKLAALNKAGHGLHGVADSPFFEYARSDKLRHLVLELGWKDPVVPQSMYIFKQARVGGVVNSHQDSTFLYTTPRQTCLGLWLALDDATLDNGCLWLRPRSHREPVRRQYQRNPDHFGAAAIAARSNEPSGDLSTPKFVMSNLYKHDISWDGSLPENGWKGLVKAGFVPVECQAGDLLVFAGELDHLSLPNTSDQPRHTFQLHLVEGPNAGITWSPSNWLQYPKDKPFMRLKCE